VLPARGSLQMQDPKIAIWAPLHNFVGLYLRNQGTHRQSEKNLLSSNISSIRSHNIVNFGPLSAEIVWLVWRTPGNFNGFRVLAALLHGTLVVGVSQTLGAEHREPPTFGRAAITFGVGSHF